MHAHQKATECKNKNKLPLQQFTISSKQQSQYTEALAYRNSIQYTLIKINPNSIVSTLQNYNRKERIAG